MKLESSTFRNSLSLVFRNSLLLFAGLVLAASSSRLLAQTKGNKSSAQTKPTATAAQAADAKPKANLKPLPRADESRERLQEGADFLRRRQDWFFKPRAFPLGFIPQGARQRALQQRRLMYQREGRFNLSAVPSGTGFVSPLAGTSSPWSSIGPQPTASPTFSPPFTSGRVTAVVVNPKNSSNVYIGGADGGLWVTTDAGTTWTALAQTENPPNTGIPSIAVGSLAVDLTACNSTICPTVYVGTGEDNFGGENVYGEGVLTCTVTAGTPPTATCTQDGSFHSPSPLDDARGGPMIGALAINPKTSGLTAVLLAGVRGRSTALKSGVYCSQDGGSTWTDVFGISGIVGTDTAFASDGTAFVALGFPDGDSANNGIYKSSVVVSSCAVVTDASGTSPGGAGSKWVKQVLPAGTPAASLGRITLAIAPSATSTGSTATIYAAIADATSGSANLLGVIRTTNGGGAWTQLTDPLVSPDSATNTSFCTAQCFWDLALAVDPANAAVVYAGGSGAAPIIRTINGTTTATFTEVDTIGGPQFPHVDTHAFGFAADGSSVYVGNDGGVWSNSAPAGTITWSNLNATLGITQFYPGVSIHPSNTGFSMGGTQDNDVQIFQGYITPSTLVWASAEIGCDGGFTAIDSAIPSTSYGECEYLPGVTNFPIIAVTFAGDGILGNGFLANAGINNADRGIFIPPLVMDPNTSTTLYFGTCRVWLTIDGANTWNAISPDLTTGAASPPATCPIPTAAGQPSGSLTTIAAAPGNSSVIYAGSDTGDVEMTSNGGTAWTSIATATLPTRSVTQVVVDPTLPSTAYVTFSGFGTCATFCSGPTGHVFKTLTSGTAWTDISGNLPDIPVNALVIDPADATHNTLYIGTDTGAFFTTTGGTTWSPLGAVSSMPNAEILSLTLHNPSRTLRAATHGRGVWDLDLGGQAAFGITSISPFTANAGSAAITTFTVNGNGFIPGTSTIRFTINGSSVTLTPTASSTTQLTATIPSTSLATGGAAAVAVVNTATTSNSMPFTVLNPVPGITSISPTTVTAGTTNLVLTVNGSGFLSGANATSVLFNGSFVSGTVTVNSPTQLTIQVPASNIATPGTISVDTFNPQPGGGPDLNPAPPTLTVIAASFTVSSTTATVNTTAGASGSTSSGTSTITLSAVQTSAVTVTCGSGTPGVSCSALSIPAGSTTGTLTINVLNPSSTLSAFTPSADPVYWAGVPRGGDKAWWLLSGGTGLAAIAFLILPGRKRYRTALALGLVCVLSFTLGCNNGYGGGGGTSATTTKISVTNAKVASGTGIAFTVTVTSTGKTPTGSVQLYDGTTTVGSATAVSSGAATINVSNLAVGTHGISAHYLGDSYTQASQSGALNVTVTGNTTVAITTTPAATPAASPVNVTIN